MKVSDSKNEFKKKLVVVQLENLSRKVLLINRIIESLFIFLLHINTCNVMLLETKGIIFRVRVHVLWSCGPFLNMFLIWFLQKSSFNSPTPPCGKTVKQYPHSNL